MKYIELFSLYASLWQVCQMTSFTSDPLTKVSESNWDFAISMYDGIDKACNSDGNIIFSPLSVEVILALCSMGAGGKTADQIRNGLEIDLKTPQEIKTGFKRLIESLPSAGRNILETAIKIFPAARFHVSKSFRDAARVIFKSDVENVDYGDPTRAAEIINEWVREKTHDKITDIVSAAGLNVNTAMVLINALYFKGEWETAFDKKDTFQDTFYVNGKSKTIMDMMHVTSKFHTAVNTELGAQLLEVPYMKKQMSFVIILPIENDGLQDVETKMIKLGLYEIYQSITQYKDVSLTLPNFSMDQSIKLNELLYELGIEDMFRGSANFSGISLDAGLSVSSVFHKAMMEVNEEGTVAAAATSVVALARAAPMSTLFVVDHPFIFAIVSKVSKVVLFMGRYTGNNRETIFDYKNQEEGGRPKRRKSSSSNVKRPYVRAREKDSNDKDDTDTASSSTGIEHSWAMMITLLSLNSCRNH